VTAPEPVAPPPPPAHRLAAEGVSFAYGGREILASVSLEVASGEIVGLIGPNGSGKTTLLRCLLGFLAPTGGRALLDGEDVSRYPRRAFARRVASVAQETPSDIPLRVAELVLLGRMPHLPMRGLGFEPPGTLERVAQALEQCGVLALAERSLHQLSGGELRRVYLARALAQEASVLLLDEPIAGLDLRHQLAILQILERQARAGTAVLAVLHDVNLAARLCHRVVLLKHGVVVASGPPREVLTPHHLSAVYDVDIRALALAPEPAEGEGAARTFLVPSLRARDRDPS
jgi:iron complex transport system ATP-binding protein